MKRSVILKTLIFLVSALLIFYFSIIQAQAKSVTMRMLIWKGYAPKNLQNQFIKIVKAKHGINVKFDIKFCKGNDAFYGALRANKADLISPSINVPKGNRFKLIKRNLVMPLDLNMIPNYKNILPSLKKADYCTENDIVYAVPHIRGSYGLAYNTNLIKTAPTSWNILWDPKYKRRYTIGGPDQYMHNVSLVALAHGISAENIYDFNKLNTAALKKKVDYLAMNAKSMWVGVDDAKTLKGLHLAVVWSFSLPS
ncbi:MAG: hypothetical protein GY714_16135 [Desulfobacterales bacterium]|nr:hypothetical protein [Desulfobacterales bacterium]